MRGWDGMEEFFNTEFTDTVASQVCRLRTAYEFVTGCPELDLGPRANTAPAGGWCNDVLLLTHTKA